MPQRGTLWEYLVNIFYSDINPEICARNLDNLRVNKMITESCQMLSTALRVNGLTHPGLYKIAYKNHPCTLWTGKSRFNFVWLCKHTEALVNEFRKFGQTGKHVNAGRILEICYYNQEVIPDREFEFPPDCTTFKSRTDLPITERYKLYLQEKWDNDVREPSWKNRIQPEWYE